MPIGIQQITKIYEDPTTGATTLASFTRVPFNHDSSFVASSTAVTKEDFSATVNDAFMVAVSYPAGLEPAFSTTLTAITAAAKAAVVAAFGASEIPS